MERFDEFLWMKSQETTSLKNVSCIVCRAGHSIDD